MNLPEDFVISKFYEHGYRVKYNRFSNTYYCACPICKEGKSINKKRRCFYVPKKDLIFCHNCGWSSKPYTWIIHVSGTTYTDLLKEVKDGDYDVGIRWGSKTEQVSEVPTLPEDSINLFDSSQIDYYHNEKLVVKAIEFIRSRRLDVAINKPRAIYFSLKDVVHKNRIILPFYNIEGDIVHYQSRKLFNFDKKEKYISKIGGVRSIYNIDRVDTNLDDVFIFEGPIDSCFAKNGIAVGGITPGRHMFTEVQDAQMSNNLVFFNKIWVLDSQWLDSTALSKTKTLLQDGAQVFIWPEKIGTRYKDFNDMCSALRLNSIHEEFIKKNTFQGMEGILKLIEAERYANR